MSYTALYRKFRPATFDEVKGQDAIVRTLTNQIRADRLGHAYLFCGTRGTGKTSVAKIFAKAVNCEHPVDGNPCNECPTCRAIAAGSSMNVIEIDAASNNGVDDVRQIRDEVAYSPTEGHFKVYIIDEVHMLSNAAFNALLKTLEEPPSYVIFILATTEVQRIPITILSRCQRYDFHRIAQDTILARLQELVAVEQVDAEEKALRYIARKGDGSLRDAVSLLDQCIAFYIGETLTYDRALEVLGAVDTDVYSDLLRKILRDDVVGAIRTLEALVRQGRDLTQFVTDFTWYLRNLMLLKSSDDMEDVLDVSTESLARLREEGAMVRNDTLMRYIRILSELSGAIRFSTNKRVQVEMALIRMCKPEAESDEISLVERIRKLERAAANCEAVFGMPPRTAAEPGRGGASAAAAANCEAVFGMPPRLAAEPGRGGVSAAAGNAPQSAGGMYGGAPQGAGGMYGNAPQGADGRYGVGAVYGADAQEMGATAYGSGMQNGWTVGSGAPEGYAGGAEMFRSGSVPGGNASVLPVAASADLKKICGMWKSVAKNAPQPFQTHLLNATPKYNAQDESDTRLYVVFPDFFGERYLNNEQRKQELEQLIADVAKVQVEVKFVLAADEGLQRGRLSEIEIDELVREQVHMEVEIED
ncbi:MAG: DNA polymerase III subunit gamma/tau [Lachnospiraceae bacterium]|nr:DNA polymerase III subunit gamma/tau [Lachnospiraceae bacterium]